MLDVFLARFLEPRLGLQVVVAVRQADAAGGDVGQHQRRLVGIGLAAEPERNLHKNVVKFGHDRLQRGQVVSGVDLGEPRFDRIQAAGVSAGFVHAGAVVVADDLRGAALGRGLVGGGSFENIVQLVLRRFSGLPATAPAGH